MTTIRAAKKSDMPWVDEQYKIMDYQPSNLENEYIAIAEHNGQRTGLGRLIKWSDEVEELGGMYVIPKFRKHGLAREIVLDLLMNRNDSAYLYCLPFEYLTKFYEGFGFRPIDEDDPLPDDIKEKHQWCNDNKNFEHRTLLYVMEPED